MANRNEHVIAITLEPIKIGQEFIEWPLHITIVPWFPCDDEIKLDEILMGISQKHPAFTVKVGPLERFGPKKDVKVNLITPNSKLTKLHREVLKNLDKNGFEVHQKEYVGPGYRPHITHQLHGHFDTGAKIEIDSFTLFKQVRLKKTGVMVKTVVRHYKLT